MKAIKKVTLSLLSLTAIMGSAYASQMECYVDTQAYDHFTPNHCTALVYGARSATAVFRISGADSQIDKVIWSGATKSCGTSGTSCSITIRSMKPYRATATVLYSNGQWESVQATASFEDGR